MSNAATACSAPIFASRLPTDLEAIERVHVCKDMSVQGLHHAIVTFCLVPNL